MIRRLIPLLLTLVVVLSACGRKPEEIPKPEAAAGGTSAVQPGAPEQPTPPQTESPQEQKPTQAEESASAVSGELSFPSELRDGELRTEALFQYTGMNPDCGDQMGTDIGALEVTNISGRHLRNLNITARLSGGTVLTFSGEDIPAGMTAWLFDRNNTAVSAGETCEELSCQAEFAAEPPMPEAITVSASGAELTISNQAHQALTGMSVTCHCLFDGIIFGGVTYTHPLDDLPAGESVRLSVEECYLGEALAVRLDRQS